MAYEIFANVYDQLMDDDLFKKWFSYTEKYVPHPKASILELGCGNGQLGILLKQAGYDITGLDLSAEMLSLAKQRQEEAGVSFPLFQVDMRDLSSFGRYDAIISFCDTLCYLQTFDDLMSVFEQAYAHLDEGGVFLFDVFTTEHIASLDGYSYHDELPGLVFTWDSFTGVELHSVEHELSFFIEQDNGQYERYDELHRERTYPLEQYLDALKKVGFTKIEVSADFDQKITGENIRWFFKAEK
ncbi:MAG TPA: class I SAM-dependent methyltransferase [Candidatus Atopostipes pullistercoris]|uniref:Class I SAM-dependent methyltransferase n=1 Tax=Candidatus Atopostipes pullistercoris TaxID=2838467 RepID=A0A9D2G0Y3_9LACT|nr:class I SAM-dependent methyltransferase [Candidatus Atopostipes pullistercoris]